jgi:sugar/nucleoside kinase (ribokinase family)
VSVDALRPVAGQRSAACFIAIDAQGRRMIFALGGEALISRPEQLDRTQFDGTRLAWIGDAFPEVALAVAGATRAQGGQVFFGPGGVMAACGLDGLAPILAASDVLVVSRGEAESLTGQADPSQAAERLRAALAAPGVVVITLGEAGAVVLSGAELARVAAFPVERVVDTTGAGDAFAAGLIAARLEGRAWEEAARMGCAAAAHKIAYTGARSGQPTRAEISEIMRKGYDR